MFRIRAISLFIKPSATRTYAQVMERKSNRTEASALGGFPDLKQLARRREHREI
ncbi:hypothetical protein I8748_15850 [Nostoc sp. CENA67]|uniref:Uncharacterized protein n=1 Tax=Amazonocrinis nigriterrae CENA67 TaxID=2794033 RepID=A0A8J7HUL0_9NOST|nr:hypothetical protein [Amazonocrinis nigriterrae]MBH8563645.1 hypothetical protein [Amazonocrinis nigriterrae CENA67]